MIQLKGVGFRYPSIKETGAEERVLSNIDLTVDQGEYLAVMGPNGSGKSTMARLFNGLLLPTEGEITVDGLNPRKLEEVWEIRRRVGMVFQNPDNQIVATTVLDDIAFGLENRGVSRDEMVERIQDAIARVGLTGLEKAAPHHLSGGQKQRLAIAGILAMRPSVIIFDEATSMLDPVGRREVIAAMKTLHQEGTTVIHITHSADEALHAERLIVMVEGQIQREGTPLQIFSKPEKLIEDALEVPLFIDLRERLRRQGMSLSQHSANSEELVEELWGLLSKG
ncbi:energy-coupling factor transport system ATP-binding protein [Marininema mesophilum]|uniref:Energy-coupling factor transport system ATP-binding protein n=1 Tax=Marininema mesophilum TaxID=1048340 RepID=A0A1H2XFI2_9BACL|nr:energy-coupling factor transporter ATPase [Marininema mesophilum]SDW91516.1 energy-coupling factor transport system ATP-binding protein [Marininema mesophilum]